MRAAPNESCRLRTTVETKPSAFNGYHSPSRCLNDIAKQPMHGTLTSTNWAENSAYRSRASRNHSQERVDRSRCAASTWEPPEREGQRQASETLLPRSFAPEENGMMPEMRRIQYSGCLRYFFYFGLDRLSLFVPSRTVHEEVSGETQLGEDVVTTELQNSAVHRYDKKYRHFKHFIELQHLAKNSERRFLRHELNRVGEQARRVFAD